MIPSSYFVNPTPLAHADTSRDVLPRGGASQHPPTKYDAVASHRRRDLGQIFLEKRKSAVTKKCYSSRSNAKFFT
ncbi:hypothetical protein TNCV_389641 [Trichonephila clavipes]|nr:hypothetical protein TNCV_389641 [Trichonephila clavipes]